MSSEQPLKTRERTKLRAGEEHMEACALEDRELAGITELRLYSGAIWMLLQWSGVKWGCSFCFCFFHTCLMAVLYVGKAWSN